MRVFYRPLVALSLALSPCAAMANLSHISGGGAILLLVLVAIFVLGPPLLATVFAEKGRRQGRYFVALLIWFGLLFLAFQVYQMIPFPTRLSWPAASMPAAVGLLLVVYLCGVFIHGRRQARASKHTVAEQRGAVVVRPIRRD